MDSDDSTQDKSKPKNYSTVLERVENVLFLNFRRDDVEKLGVVLDDAKTKTAAEGGNCPKCGSKLNERTSEDGFFTQSCPLCGVEPFEKRNTDG
jgi:hypothetical protein